MLQWRCSDLCLVMEAYLTWWLYHYRPWREGWWLLFWWRRSIERRRLKELSEAPDAWKATVTCCCAVLLVSAGRKYVDIGGGLMQCDSAILVEVILLLLCYDTQIGGIYSEVNCSLMWWWWEVLLMRCVGDPSDYCLMGCLHCDGGEFLFILQALPVVEVYTRMPWWREMREMKEMVGGQRENARPGEAEEWPFTVYDYRGLRLRGAWRRNAMCLEACPVKARKERRRRVEERADWWWRPSECDWSWERLLKADLEGPGEEALPLKWEWKWRKLCLKYSLGKRENENEGRNMILFWNENEMEEENMKLKFRRWN